MLQLYVPHVRPDDLQHQRLNIIICDSLDMSISYLKHQQEITHMLITTQ